MILQASPDAPMLLRFGAVALLALHIGGGSVGMASGAVAMLARKGGRVHAVAGTTFLASMLTMTVVATFTAPFIADPLGARAVNTLMAVFTAYLVLTGWMTAKRRDGGFGRLETVAVVAPITLLVVSLGMVVIQATRPLAHGDYAPSAFFILAAVTGLAAASDLAVIRRGVLGGRDRLARHVWRMSAALFIAMGSFFLGQQQVLPDAVRGTLLQFGPVLAVIALGTFWFVRVRFAWKRRPNPLAA